MANLYPRAYDVTSGQLQDLSSTDTLTDIDGSPIASPTPANWGSNSQVLSATLNLTDASGPIQFLDPNGADRIVNLPTAATSNPLFVIFNSGSSGRLILTAPDGTIQYISAGEAVRVYTDGTNYAYENLGSLTSALTNYQSYNFGGRINADTDWWWANGATDDTPTGTADADTFHAVIRNGTIKFLSWFGLSTAVEGEIQVYVNSILERNIGPIIGKYGRIDLTDSPISISAGDDLSIRFEGSAGTDPVDSTVYVAVLADTVGHHYTFGGDPTATGQHFRCNERASSGTTLSATLNYDTEHTVAIAGTVSHVSYRTTTGDNTTQFALVRNGSPAETFLLSGAVGVETGLSTAFSAGDTLAVEYDAGTDPTDCTIIVEMSGAGQTYSFGGDGTVAAPFFYKPNATSANSTGITVFDGHIGVRVIRGGTVSISWGSEGVGSGTFDFWKNGSIDQTFGDASTTSGTASITNTVAEGDLIAVGLTSGATDPGDTIIDVVVQ